MPWNNFSFSTSAFIHLASEHIDKKIAALSQYESQQQRAYAAERSIRGLARIRGTQAGVDYAEAFQVVRWMIR
jgi:hypothetical protein